MRYKTFIKNSLQSNDIKSLKKYDKLTQKLATKDKKFSKYLLSSNKKLIKQYGGGSSFGSKCKYKNQIESADSGNPILDFKQNGYNEFRRRRKAQLVAINKAAIAQANQERKNQDAHANQERKNQDDQAIHAGMNGQLKKGVGFYK